MSEDRIRRALLSYSNHAPLDLKKPHQLQRDLRAIAGEPHYHVASIGSDLCLLCQLDLRDDVHIREKKS